MAKAPWARLTKPINPMVTESPTDTMNSTMPAAAAQQDADEITAKIHGRSPHRRAANGGQRAANSGDILCANRGFRHSPPSPWDYEASHAQLVCAPNYFFGAQGPSLLLAGVLDAVDLPITFW